MTLTGSINNNGYADLHNHTTASDGLLTPSELVQFAKIKKIKCLAITDHDTTNGIDEGIDAGIKTDINVVPGIELNTQYEGVEIHLLGYYIKYNLSWFQELLKNIRDSRENRAEKMVEKLRRIYNIDITYEEVVAEAKEGAVARPHIARILMEKGIVSDVSEAFNKYIGNDNSAYVDRFRLTPKEGIDVIERAGGVPCLAHPGLLSNPLCVMEVIKQGIKGIEVYHSKHSDKHAQFFSKLALKHGLIITGGSDCHGELQDNLPIIGDITVDEESVLQLWKLSSLI